MNMYFFVADHFQMQEVSLKILAHLSNGSDKIRHRIVQVSVWGSNTVSCLICKSRTIINAPVLFIAMELDFWFFYFFVQREEENKVKIEDEGLILYWM